MKSIFDDLDHVNSILNCYADDGMVEPIDDPNNLTDFWDWADVVGIVDEFVPVEYR